MFEKLYLIIISYRFLKILTLYNVHVFFSGFTNCSNFFKVQVKLKLSSPCSHLSSNLSGQAYKQGMYGPRYVWILVGSYKRQWWRDGRGDDVECSQNQLAVAVEGAFTIFDFNGLLEENKSINNLVRLLAVSNFNIYIYIVSMCLFFSRRIILSRNLFKK